MSVSPPESTDDTSLDRMAHDLKNLMGIILGFTEMLLSEIDRHDERGQALVEIQKAGQTAVTIAARLSELARARDGK